MNQLLRFSQQRLLLTSLSILHSAVGTANPANLFMWGKPGNGHWQCIVHEWKKGGLLSAPAALLLLFQCSESFPLGQAHGMPSLLLLLPDQLSSCPVRLGVALDVCSFACCCIELVDGS